MGLTPLCSLQQWLGILHGGHGEAVLGWFALYRDPTFYTRFPGCVASLCLNVHYLFQSSDWYTLHLLGLSRELDPLLGGGSIMVLQFCVTDDCSRDGRPGR